MILYYLKCGKVKMINIFNNDCILHVIKFLDCETIYNMRKLNKNVKRRIKFEHFKQVLINELYNKLNFMGDFLPNFIETLKKYNCIIYGSSIIQLLTIHDNKNYIDSDIDICVQSSYYDLFINYLLNNGFVRNHVKKTPYDNSFIDDLYFKEYKFQIIKKNNFDVNDSDFNICKNAIFFKPHEINVKISDLNAIYNRILTIDITKLNDSKNLRYRIMKYKQRGYNPKIPKNISLTLLTYYFLMYIKHGIYVEFKFNRDIYEISKYYNFIETNHKLKCKEKSCIIKILCLETYIEHYHIMKSTPVPTYDRVKQLSSEWIDNDNIRATNFNVEEYLHINNSDNLFEKNIFNGENSKDIYTMNMYEFIREKIL